MPEENIDEIIEDILKGEEKGEEEEEIMPEEEEIYECPTCHHTVPEDAKFCPYCFTVFDESVDYKMILETIIRKMRKPLQTAIKMGIDVSNTMMNIKKTKEYALSKNYTKGYETLQSAYVFLIKEVIENLKNELVKYEVLIGLDSEIRDMYSKAGTYLDEWDIESFMPLFEEIKKKSMEVSKELKGYLEKLESVENALKIAKNFNIDVTKSENIIDTAKDMAENKKYGEASKLLDDAFTPIKDEIEDVIKKFLTMVKNEVMRESYSGKTTTKKIIKLVREIKIHLDEGDYVKVLERIDKISKEISE